ncbi:hypothetical protein C8Q80DRAFT_1142307 [Daedaleopsis nitida]|nr:hypothetical protein C8Q80DRAFT_1142307 [Daedaleopsis nitida]
MGYVNGRAKPHGACLPGGPDMTCMSLLRSARHMARQTSGLGACTLAGNALRAVTGGPRTFTPRLFPASVVPGAKQYTPRWTRCPPACIIVAHLLLRLTSGCPDGRTGRTPTPAPPGPARAALSLESMCTRARHRGPAPQSRAQSGCSTLVPVLINRSRRSGIIPVVTSPNVLGSIITTAPGAVVLNARLQWRWPGFDVGAAMSTLRGH